MNHRPAYGKSPAKLNFAVIPAKAGIHSAQESNSCEHLDSGFRRNDRLLQMSPCELAGPLSMRFFRQKWLKKRMDIAVRHF
jgi:hypothetical protein